MKTKNWIRVFVVAALFAWPGVETYRLWTAKQELAASQKLEQNVNQRLAEVKARNAAKSQVAARDDQGQTQTP